MKKCPIVGACWDARRRKRKQVHLSQAVSVNMAASSSAASDSPSADRTTEAAEPSIRERIFRSFSFRRSTNSSSSLKSAGAISGSVSNLTSLGLSGEGGRVVEPAGAPTPAPDASSRHVSQVNTSHRQSMRPPMSDKEREDNLYRLRRAIEELLTTERAFVKDMEDIHYGYEQEIPNTVRLACSAKRMWAFTQLIMAVAACCSVLLNGCASFLYFVLAAVLISHW
jgi:hypothetical protein